MTITADVVFVLCIGILVGYLLCHLRYRLCEATAAILRGTGKYKEPLLDKSTREFVAMVFCIASVITGIIIIVFLTQNYCELKERALMIDKGYEYVRVDGSYRWKMKLAPPELDNDLAGVKDAK